MSETKITQRGLRVHALISDGMGLILTQ